MDQPCDVIGFQESMTKRITKVSLDSHKLGAIRTVVLCNAFSVSIPPMLATNYSTQNGTVNLPSAFGAQRKGQRFHGGDARPTIIVDLCLA